MLIGNMSSTLLAFSRKCLCLPEVAATIETMKYTRGFTIVEIIVVITAIAILAAITTVTYSGLQVRARDDERLSDIEVISSALETYYEKQGTYPSIRQINGTETGHGMTFLENTLRIPESALVAPGSASGTTNSLAGTGDAGQNPTDSQYLYYVENNVGPTAWGGICWDPVPWSTSPPYQSCARYTLKYFSEADSATLTKDSKFGH